MGVSKESIREDADINNTDIAECVSKCCQTCANRVCIETARSGNIDSFVGCVKSKA